MRDATTSGEREGRAWRLLFAACLAAAFAFRAWYMATLPLSGDEAYHWEWSRNLAFGYYDHPGLTAYLIRLSTWLCGGGTEFSVRLPALVMLTATAGMAWALARAAAFDLGLAARVSERAGVFAGLFVLAAPLTAFLAMYISTDPPLVFFWAAALLCLHRAFHRGGWGWWLLGGVAVGGALLSKFLAFFLVAGLALYVAAAPGARRWIRRPQPYAAAAVALALFAPFLWWNATHGWATFVFNFVRRQGRGDPSALYLPEFIAGQALALSPVLFGIALWGLWRAARDRQGASRQGLFFLLSWGVLAGYLLAVALRRRIGLHWTAGAWVGAGVWAAVVLSRAMEGPSAPRARRWAVAGIAVAVAMVAALQALAHAPMRWFDFRWTYPVGPRQANAALLAERYGWREMGARVARMRQDLLDRQGGDRRGVFVIAHEYGLSANVAFYTPGQPRTHLWSRRKTHGENYRFWDDYPALRGQDAVFVATSETKAVRAHGKLSEHFERVEEPERLPIAVDGRVVRSFWLTRCHRFDGRTPSFGGGDS